MRIFIQWVELEMPAINHLFERDQLLMAVLEVARPGTALDSRNTDTDGEQWPTPAPLCTFLAMQDEGITAVVTLPRCKERCNQILRTHFDPALEQL